MKTLYQIVCYKSKHDSQPAIVFSSVYEDKQQAERVIERKEELAKHYSHISPEFDYVIRELRFYEKPKIVYGMADTEEGQNILRKRILADNAIKAEDDELDNNKPCGCEAHKICLMCFDD